MPTPAAPLPCDATSGLALPAGWPADLPLPEGLLVTRTEQRSGERLIATGRVAGDFHAVVTFFADALPKAGWTPRETEVDPLDAESDFRGEAEGEEVEGRWTAGRSAECPGQSKVTVLVGPGEEPDRSPSRRASPPPRPADDPGHAPAARRGTGRRPVPLRRAVRACRACG